MILFSHRYFLWLVWNVCAVAVRPDSISALPEYSTYIRAPSLVAEVAFIFSLVSFKDTTSDIKRVPFGSSPN